MITKKFNVLMEEVISRYQQGGLVTGDFVKIRKDALSNEKLKDRPSNFQELLKKTIETELPLRVSAVKSERPESSNDLIGGANHASTGFWVDVCIEYAPGLWRDPMTLPIEVLDIANPEDYNLPKWPDEVRRDNGETIKPEEVERDSKEMNIKQTQGDERSYDSTDGKMPTGATKDGRDQTKIKESLEEVYGSILTENEKIVRYMKEHGSRETARALVNQYVKRMAMVSLDDLADLPVLMNGVDAIEVMLNSGDFKRAKDTAEETAEDLLAEEGFDSMFGESLEGIYQTILESENKLKGGLADSMSESDFDEEQLNKGIEVEMEHTKSKGQAKEIAMDHLAEDPKYYDKLEKIEESEQKEVRLTLKKDMEYNEWQVKVYIDGKYNEDETYFSLGGGLEEKQDAIDSLKKMKKEYENKGYNVKVSNY